MDNRTKNILAITLSLCFLFTYSIVVFQVGSLLFMATSLTLSALVAFALWRFINNLE